MVGARQGRAEPIKLPARAGLPSNPKWTGAAFKPAWPGTDDRDHATVTYSLSHWAWSTGHGTVLCTSRRDGSASP
jgi:hypothetical protein